MPDYVKVPEPGSMPDPRTTASVGEKRPPDAEPNQDALAVVKRLREGPRKNDPDTEPLPAHP